jgi:hypothetical protein
MAMAAVTRKPWTAPPQSVRKILPKSYFLLPSKLKFPYREWRGADKGKININALKSALRLARMHGYKQVAAKAERLLKRYQQSKS